MVVEEEGGEERFFFSFKGETGGTQEEKESFELVSEGRGTH